MFSAKVLLFLSCAVAIVMAVPDDPPIVGGVEQLEGDDLKEAEKVLSASLTKLAAGDGPNYTISKIISATSQVVSGSLHKFVVQLSDEKKEVKKCNVDIWSQPWLPNGIQVTFKCGDEPALVKKHSS